MVRPVRWLLLCACLHLTRAAAAAGHVPQATDVQANAATGVGRAILLVVHDVETLSSNLVCTVGAAAHGTVSPLYPAIYPKNSRWVLYTATNGYTGVDAFTFHASDGVASSATATCTIVVGPNTPPQAGCTMSEAASGCADSIDLNVIDKHTREKFLACSIVDPPNHGTVVHAYPDDYPTNSYQMIYTPTNGYAGMDVFTFLVSDGAMTSSVATCTVSVVENTRPNASGTSATAAPGTQCRVWLNGFDDHTPWGEIEYFIVTNPLHGSAVMMGSQPNEAVYVATNGFTGQDTFSYAVSDGVLTSEVAAVTITVVTNTRPRALNVSEEMSTSSSRLRIWLNCSDTETTTELLACTILAQPTNGTVAYASPTTVPTNSCELIYTLTNAVVGTDVFTYQASDGDLVSAVATASVTVVSNTAPTAYDRSASVVENAFVDIWLSGSDPETWDDLVYLIVDPPDHGIVVYRYPERFPVDSRSVTYVPDAGYSGSDSFTYKLNDGELDSNIATVSITVENNTAPTASEMSLAATEGIPETVSLNVGDDETGAWSLECVVVDGPDHGSLVYNDPDQYPNSSYRMIYTADMGYGGPDSFTFRASDGELVSGIATCLVTVVSNSPPTATDMAETGVENTTLNIDLDVADPDTSAWELECIIVDQATNGLVEYRWPASYPDSSYRVQYTPNTNYTGPDSFTFKVTDGMYTSATATCTLTIGSNTVPVAHDVRASTVTSTAVSVSAEYTDPDPGQSHTVVVISNAVNGDVDVAGMNMTYTPDPGFAGIDTFTYRVNDGQDDSNVARAQVQVRDPADRASNLVIVVVRDTLFTEISNEVARLQADLVNEGYTTKLKTFGSVSVSTLWDYLNTEYLDANQWLNGAILIGSLPIPTLDGGHKTDLAYWNMNELVTEGGVYDFHIWISRIYSSGSTYGNEVTLIKRALQTNHDYRTGKSRIPHTAYYYHAWDSYAAGDDYGAALTNVWPDLLHTNEVGNDHQANAEFFPAWNLNEAGADALVGGGEIFQETSHGNSGSYMNGRFNRTDLHRLGSQQRFIMVESCTSGAYGGIANHHILTRLGGTIFTVGGSEINYVNDFQLADPFGTSKKTVRQRLAMGDSWGNALLANYPFRANNRTVYFGDLSTGAMASPPNGIPRITSLTVDNDTPRVGEAITFTIEVSDPDAGGSDSPHYDFEHQADWWPQGYNDGKNDPLHTTNSNSSGWTNCTHAYPASGTYRIRVEVMDEWQARGWKEITVTVNDPAVAVDDSASVEAGRAVTINVLTNDYDPNGDAFSIDSFTDGSHGTVAQDGEALVYSSTGGVWTGMDEFTYTIRDVVSGSSTATVTVDVVADETGPTPVWVSNAGRSNRVTVVFDEPVEAGTGSGGAENAANYALNNKAGVVSARLLPDTRTVYLGVTGLLEYVEYVLVVRDVHDRAPAPNAADSQTAFLYSFVVAEDDLESGDELGGTGWASAWSLNSDAGITGDRSPHGGNYHFQLVRYGATDREVDMAGVTDATLELWWKAHSLDNSSETCTVDVCDGDWHTAIAIQDGEDDDAYHFTNVSLGAYAMASNFSVRCVIHGSGSADYFHVDDLRIVVAGSGKPSDGDGDGMADNWEIIHFGATNVSHGTILEDQDGDGSCDRYEYLAGTDPCDPTSCLDITDVMLNGGGDAVLSWRSVAGKTYAIEAGSNLVDGFVSNVDSNIPATPPLNIYTSTVNGEARRFYRVHLED